VKDTPQEDKIAVMKIVAMPVVVAAFVWFVAFLETPLWWIGGCILTLAVLEAAVFAIWLWE
jgi:hypothetical protein